MVASGRFANYEGRTRGVLGLDCFARLAMTVRRPGAPRALRRDVGRGGFETRPYVDCALMLQYAENASRFT
ncbi:MAG: hypothetical protein LBM98_07415 [Oscillospiraceae bacterium]|nr:hypothetical protein [Oscillospiraceae bacterium]